MELLAPAGTPEKLRIAYRYGADAAYVGVPGFSLRSSAERVIAPGNADRIRRIAAGRRLYAAFNIFAQRRDLERLPEVLAELSEYPIDALIVSDIGLVEPILRAMPGTELHLSTQANCTNASAAAIYHSMGFSRIVPSRELSLDEIKAIKDSVPELEIELFVHGAMCMAFSGRCFLSEFTTGRSANRGDCAHTCRWNFALTEEKRPGEYFPVEEDGRYLSILSSRDLMLYDHLQDLADAGIDAIKIEGRMKSSLYTATTVRAYRTALDALTRGNSSPEAAVPGTPPGTEVARWRQELLDLSHRPYTRGFLFEDPSIHDPALENERRGRRLLGVLTERRTIVTSDGDLLNAVVLEARNNIGRDDSVEIMLPDGEIHTMGGLDLVNGDGGRIDEAVHGRESFLVPGTELAGRDLSDAIIRSRT